MSDPLSVISLALAARGGSVNGLPTAQLVAAGTTLLQRCPPLVRALAGRRSAVLLPTGHAFLTALAASDGRGAVLVNPLAAPPEIAYQLRDAGAGAVFTSAALAPRLPSDILQVHLDDAPRTARVLDGGVAREIDLGSHTGLELAGEADAPGRDEEAAIVYTSAMAGAPLGAVLTHRNLLANARSMVQAARCEASDHMLAVLPFSHLFGLVVAGLGPLLAGSRVTAPDRFHPLRAIETMETQGITQIVGVPAIFRAIVAALERRGTPLAASALRVCICGGAPLTEALQARWAELTGVELRQGYGLTEGGPVCLFNAVDRPNRRGALGTPFPDVAVSVREPATGAEVADGEVGELCVRGDNVSPGYVRGGDAGLGRRDGWLRTGDLGRRRADGVFEFAGVLKPMATRNGYNIYPRELERAVLELDGVRAATVRFVPDAEHEHEIHLAVVGDVTLDAVRRWCAARLSAYKQPSAITVATR